MCKGPIWTFLKTNSQKAHENMLSIISHGGKCKKKKKISVRVTHTRMVIIKKADNNKC